MSAPSVKQSPIDEGKEVAFAGRSNAGKSSVINTLTDNKKLARTSKKPGRTQSCRISSRKTISCGCGYIDGYPAPTSEI